MNKPGLEPALPPAPEEQNGETGLNELLSRIPRILVRRLWWILIPLPVAAVLSAVVLHFVPNRYTSEATILVVRQQVPERYVTPTSSSDVSKALNGMTEQILSRTRLLSIIDELNLYPKQRAKLAPEALLDRMRNKDVRIVPLEENPERQEINAIRISFVYSDPHTAQRVASRLTTLFIQENLKSREAQATITTRFLVEQLDQARAKLAAQEQLVRDFKLQFLGELPEQSRGNVEILAGLQGQLQNAVDSLSRAQQQRLYFQSLLSQHRRGATRRGLPVPGGAPETPAQASALELARLKSEFAALADRYSALHPDLIAKKKEVARKQAEYDAEVAAEASRISRRTDQAEAPAPNEAGEDDLATAQIISQLEANRREIEDLSKATERLKGEVEQYRQRLNMTPVREQQLAGILRDYEMLKLNYADLLGKKLQSELAATLEKRQEGQQFRLVDAPSLPTVPSGPKRKLIALGALAGALLLGCGLAALREIFDSSPRAESDCRRFGIPLVVGVPQFLTPRETSTKAFRRIFEWVGACAALFVTATAEAWTLLLH